MNNEKTQDELIEDGELNVISSIDSLAAPKWIRRKMQRENAKRVRKMIKKMSKGNK